MFEPQRSPPEENLQIRAGDVRDVVRGLLKLICKCAAGHRLRAIARAVAARSVSFRRPRSSRRHGRPAAFAGAAATGPTQRDRACGFPEALYGGPHGDAAHSVARLGPILPGVANERTLPFGDLDPLGDRLDRFRPQRRQLAAGECLELFAFRRARQQAVGNQPDDRLDTDAAGVGDFAIGDAEIVERAHDAAKEDGFHSAVDFTALALPA